MILKVIAFIFAYLLCGTGTLELIRLHDRHSKWLDKWGADDADETDEVMVIVLFPLMLLFMLLWVLGKIIALFTKTIRTVVTTVIYTTIALIKGDNGK